MLLRLRFYAALALAGIAVPVSAEWNTDSRVRNVVTIADSGQKYPGMCSDGHGGAIIAWEDQHLDSVHVYVFIQRLDDQGVPLWRGNGFPVTTCVEDFQHKPRLCTDGAGGAIIGFYQDANPVSRQILASRVDSTGQRVWNCQGVQINHTSSATELVNVFSDGAGGAYFVWTSNDYSINPARYTIYVTRINGAGNPVWSTPVTVISMTGNLYRVSTGTDSLGNVFVGWMAFTASPPARYYVAKITPAGGRPWNAAGVAVVDTLAMDGAVTGDQNGGAFVTTSYLAKAGFSAISRVASNGTVSWSKKFADNVNTYRPLVVVDGYGGVIGACETHVIQGPMSPDHIIVWRLNGTATSGWSGVGIPINDPDGTNVGPYVIVNDGMGGVIAAWVQSPYSASVNANHLDSTGKFLWGTTGKRVCNSDSTHIGVLGVRDYPEQILCTWTDNRDTATRADIYATKLGDPWLATLDSIIDFGRVNVGDTLPIVRPKFIRNIGVEDLNISADNLAGINQNEFSIDNDTTDLLLKYRDTRELRVGFEPRTAGAKTADIHYTSNTKFYSPVIHLRGRGVLPGLTVTPIIDYGNQTVATLRDSILVKIVRSSGSGFLHVDSIRMTGASGAFTFDSSFTVPTVLDSGQFITLKIGFKPVKSGLVVDTLFVYTNLPSRGLIRLLGTGTKGSLKFAVQGVDFGDVLVSTPSDTTMADMPKNPGSTDTVRVMDMSFHGGDSSQFSLVSSSIPFKLAPGKSLQSTLRFLPTTIRAKASTLVATTSSGDQYTLAVRGNGVLQRSHRAVLTIAAATVDLGDTLVGMKRDSILPAWVKNSGDTILTVSKMTIAGTNAAEFNVDDSLLGFSIDAGSTKALTVHFSPQSVGLKTAQLIFECNSASPPEITLLGRAHSAQGVGILSVNANRIDCGASGVGVPRNTLQRGFVHNRGTAALTISGMNISGANAGDFILLSAQTFTLFAGDSANVTMRFTPTAVAVRNATLTIHANNGDSSVVNLTGLGSLSKLGVAFASIDFGRVPVGTQVDTTLPAFITNTGNDTAKINAIQFAGVDALSFTIFGTTTPLLLPPQSSVPIVLRFRPLRTGVYGADLLLIAGIDTIHVAVTGRGVRQITLAAGSAHGLPGATVLVPVTADSSLGGTFINGLDMKFVFAREQFYPTGVATSGTSTTGWAFTIPTVNADTISVHGTGIQPLTAGTHLFDLQGIILQSSTVQATITIQVPTPVGDADVAMRIQSVGMITMDTLCGYGTHTFTTTRSGPFLVWSPAPNPVTGMLQIQYLLRSEAIFSAVVRDEQSRVVARVEPSTKSAGEHVLTVDIRTLTPGVYQCTMFAAGLEETRRFVVTR